VVRAKSIALAFARLPVLRALVGAFVIAFGWGNAALAELRICNDTGELQSIALGFKGETDWTSKGWWNIQSGDCATVVSGDLTKRYYYYFADSKSGGFRGQEFLFCVQDTSFEIVGDTDCDTRGLDQSSFREIDTGETAKAFTLTLNASKGSDTGVLVKAPGGGSGSGEIDTQTVTETPDVTDVTNDVADLTSTLSEGRHGKPIKIAALFQGCELDGGRAFCSFHANGVKYRTFYGGPTPDDLLFALEAMDVNAFVQVEADAVETRGQERAIVVRSVRANPSNDKYVRVRRALQGDWVAADDRHSALTIRGSEIYVRYKGDFKAARYLQIADGCDGYLGARPVMLQTGQGETRVKCYEMAETGSKLRLVPVKGGNTLVFRRP